MVDSPTPKRADPAFPGTTRLGTIRTHVTLRPPHQYFPSPAHSALLQWSRATTSVRGAIGVAYSGGADSTVLLMEEARMRLALQHGVAVASCPPLLAFHVNHGLQAAADTFERHCDTFCEALNLHLPTRLCVARVKVDLPPGASLEAQAREARYGALAALARAHGVGTVLLAQHADDQIETVLIALSRGAGLAGISGMALEFEHDGVQFARPMLEVVPDGLKPWLHASEIPFLEDPSNADERFTRNRLRQRVLPPLKAALPALHTTLARSARLARVAQDLIEEVSAEDLGRVGDPPSIRMLQALGQQRRANVVRHWLKVRHQTTGSEAQTMELLRVIQSCVTRGHGIHIRVGRGTVERAGDHLDFKAFL